MEQGFGGKVRHAGATTDGGAKCSPRPIGLIRAIVRSGYAWIKIQLSLQIKSLCEKCRDGLHRGSWQVKECRNA